jgi:hypothetical protein
LCAKPSNQANHGRKNGGREILRRWLGMTFLSVGAGKIGPRKTAALPDQDARSTKLFSLRGRKPGPSSNSVLVCQLFSPAFTL